MINCCLCANYRRNADLSDIQDDLGSTDISSIGDGSVTGAISEINSNKIYKYANYLSLGSVTSGTDYTYNITSLLNNSNLKRSKLVSLTYGSIAGSALGYDYEGTLRITVDYYSDDITLNYHCKRTDPGAFVQLFISYFA